MQTAYLGLVGGLTVKAATTAVMKNILATDLARSFNFCGHRGKHAFSGLQLKEVVCGWCCSLSFVTCCNNVYIGWQWRNLFVLYLCQLLCPPCCRSSVEECVVFWYRFCNKFINMPAYCCAFNCTNRNTVTFRQTTGIKFYRFPKDPVRRSQWAAAVRRVGFVPSDSTRICSVHFVTGL